MSIKIGDYILEKPLANQNAGYSKWGFGMKNGKEFFIKELLTPVYPEDNGIIGKATIDKKRKYCKEFEEKQCELIKLINFNSDGNLLRIHQFFRYGTKYYIVAEKINSHNQEILSSLSFEEKFKLLKILAHSLSRIHEKGIVHGDIKLDNILFTRTRQGFVGCKIIDVDGCFFEKQPPEPDYLVVDPVYMAPETFEYIATESGTVGCKEDVFAMGIVFHQIMTGTIPNFDTDKYEYAYECVLDGGSLRVNCSLKILFEIMTNMLCRNPDERLSMKQVYELLMGSKKNSPPKPPVSPVKKEKKPVDEKGFFVQAGDL